MKMMANEANVRLAIRTLPGLAVSSRYTYFKTRQEWAVFSERRPADSLRRSPPPRRTGRAAGKKPGN